jgi:sigma-B regulation protein RsbU (phosphoserine phosphatase)
MKISLRIKTVCATLAAALILMAIAVNISYQVYSNTIYEQYETTTMNLAKTVAVTIDAGKMKVLRDQVMEIYRDICEESGGVPDFENFTDTDWEMYYARYERVEKIPEYQEILELLHKFSNANDVQSIYVGYLDVETRKGVYIADGSIQTEPCLTGACDPLSEENAKQIMRGEYDFPAYITNYEEYGWLCSAGVGIVDESGKMVGTATVDVSMDEIMQNRQDFLVKLCLVLSGITLGILLLILFAINKVLLVPINSLARAAASFVSDKEKGGTDKVQSAISRLAIHTGDEIENLSESVKKMEIEINEYIDNLTAVTAEKERMGAELNVATQIQASMLPCIFPAFPDRKEFDIYATMEPAKEVGGDFYDFFLVDNDHIAMVMADVSGKGVPAALFMVIAKTLLKNSAQGGMPPEKVLEKVNNQLCENNDAEMFVTVWLGIMEISTGKMVCANAGHEYPAVRRADGAYELLRDKHGFVLAGMEGARYRGYELTLNPGDCIFVYTDGVPEATNASNELFGTNRMLAALNRGRGKGCQELLGTVRREIQDFVGGAPQFDDITMLSLEYRG